MLKGMRSVAALDGEVEVLGEHANAGPALGLHLVDVFHAGQGGNHVGSSSLGSLLDESWPHGPRLLLGHSWLLLPPSWGTPRLLLATPKLLHAQPPLRG